MKLFITLFFAGLFSLSAQAQVKQRKLGPPGVNFSSFNYWKPYVCLDGNTLVFIGDDTDDKTIGAFLSQRTGVDWKEPIMIPKRITANSFLSANTLSPDGKTLFISARRGMSMGGFDILWSQFAGTFTDPQPMGAPINSASNEAAPTFSPDGNTIYFMRCTKMTFESADDCKIMMSRKKNNMWESPTELPPAINAGNSQMPRMLADGESFIFSSNKHTPSKGGMDLYMAKLADGQWSAPVNLEFVNTTGDDIYAAASSAAVYLMKDAKGDKKSELVEFQFPPELKPKATVRVMGNVEGLTDLTAATITLINLETKKTIYNFRPNEKGGFVCYIPEGNLYGLFVDPPTENFQYFGKRYDLRNSKKLATSDKVVATLKPISPGDEMELTGIAFKPTTSELDPTSVIELQKIARMIRGNPGLNFNVDVSLFGLLKDSIQTEDLNEATPDTVVYQKEFQLDSLTTEMRDSLAIEFIYHNDRTQKQAQSILAFLTKQAVKPEKISLTYKAVEEPVAEKRRTVVYLKAR
jgi:WD40-like Beta Propeller Repeat